MKKFYEVYYTNDCGVYCMEAFECVLESTAIYLAQENHHAFGNGEIKVVKVVCK